MQIQTLLYNKLWTTVVGSGGFMWFLKWIIGGGPEESSGKKRELEGTSYSYLMTRTSWAPVHSAHSGTRYAEVLRMNSGQEILWYRCHHMGGGTPRLPSSGRWRHQEGAAERLANEGKWGWPMEAWTPEQVRSGRHRRNVYLQPWGGVFSFITCASKSSSDVSNTTGYAGREHHMLTKGVFGHHTNQHCLLPRPEP